MQDLGPGSPYPQAQLIASPTASIPLTSVTKALGLQLQGTNHRALLPAPTDGLLTTAPSPAPAYFLGYFPSFHKRASARHRRDAPMSPPSGAARSGPRGGGSRGRGLPQGSVCRRKAADAHLPGDFDSGAVTHHDACYFRNKLLFLKKARFLNSYANTKGLQGREQAFLGGCGGAPTGTSFLQPPHSRAQTRQGA